MSQISQAARKEKPWSETASDYLLLTKPWIVALLLTTTLCGMLIAARGLPPLSLLFLTLLGGACAAGGANALNSFIDRDTDKIMGRTARRPLPSGKIAPRNALLFALTLCVLSMVILGFGVNWLAAMLSAVGIVYYAFVYTVLLKRLTPQNIVIGGGAGALPPLVGWAAATNDLNLLAWYLFAIIFLWTPPHTWALMLLVEKDYRKAAIPMLPAAWGQAEARRHIILYSILLVIVTLMPFLFRGLGWIYLVGAILLGAYFLTLAARLWFTRDASKFLARKLYHYSNAYLATLFILMVVDSILLRT
ncbi:MAG: protoheme IX farnesyltransferase [Chloroflexi bacterium]|nr:protoheme IX farnesyltransferase [Chloroflexota bacterium]